MGMSRIVTANIRSLDNYSFLSILEILVRNTLFYASASPLPLSTSLMLLILVTLLVRAIAARDRSVCYDS
jgi:hypothetical protein